MLSSSKISRRIAPIALAAVVGCAGFAPSPAAAGFFDFLFGTDSHGGRPQGGGFDPFGQNPAPAPAAPRPHGEASRTTGYCVRSCDGRYFPVQARGTSSPAQVCQAFCPAASTKVYFGGNIDYATSATGERYADSDNAYAYRKALKADCTCNGRDPAGLAPIDLSLDSTLRPGDIVATSGGLVAYSGNSGDPDPATDFTPVANYPGLTAEVRAKLGEMKVAPVSSGLVGGTATPTRDNSRVAPTQGSLVPKTTNANRAALD